MTPRILVVDDEPAVRAMVVRALQEDGYDVVALADGAVGLEAATHAHFDLVITNDCMPRMSGDELTAHLRQRRPDLPILRVGGLPRERTGETLPDEHHLYKPFGMDALQHTVRELLNSRAR